MAVARVVRLVGAAMSLAALAKLLSVRLLWNPIRRNSTRCPFLVLTFPICMGCSSLNLGLKFLIVFLEHDTLNIL